MAHKDLDDDGVNAELEEETHTCGNENSHDPKEHLHQSQLFSLSCVESFLFVLVFEVLFKNLDESVSVLR